MALVPGIGCYSIGSGVTVLSGMFLFVVWCNAHGFNMYGCSLFQSLHGSMWLRERI